MAIKFFCDGCGKELGTLLNENEKKAVAASDEFHSLCSDCMIFEIDPTAKKILEFQGDYRWLSNFWLCSIPYAGHFYQSVEHAYQAAKTLDNHERCLIASAKTPGEAKKLGRTIKIRPDWEDIKIPTMTEFVSHKFHSHPQLRKKLLATGNSFIQEGNYWGDEFWGVNLKNGKGENWLGKIIMRVRKNLREEGWK